MQPVAPKLRRYEYEENNQTDHRNHTHAHCIPIHTGVHIRWGIANGG